MAKMICKCGVLLQVWCFVAMLLLPPVIPHALAHRVFNSILRLNAQ